MSVLRSSPKKVFWILASLYLIQWMALAFNVEDRRTWILENILVIAFIFPLAWAYAKDHLTTPSYVLLFIFLSLHNLGAHFTYGEVPYDHWTRQLFGFSIQDFFGFERNHYDRLVHFLSGVLFYFPMREFLQRYKRINPPVSSWLAFLAIAFISSSFELIEWMVAEVLGEAASMNYLGAQGDVWDAHKDHALATSGALISMIIVGLLAKRSKEEGR